MACLAAPAGAVAAEGVLPPPPYAAQGLAPALQSETSARMRGAAPAFDRYGGGVAHAPIASAAGLYPAPYPAKTAPAYAGPRLAWGGKSVEAPQSSGPTRWRTAQVRSPYAPPLPTPLAAPRARLQYPSMAMAEPASLAASAASAPEAYAPPVYAPPVRQTAAITSIYDRAPTGSAPVNPAMNQTPAMPGPPVRTASAAPGDGPRLYSLHRDYGMAPDPIPLAPQFFGPTADLTAPETPEVGHRTTTSTGATRNAPIAASGEQ